MRAVTGVTTILSSTPLVEHGQRLCRYRQILLDIISQTSSVVYTVLASERGNRMEIFWDTDRHRDQCRIPSNPSKPASNSRLFLEFCRFAVDDRG